MILGAVQAAAVAEVVADAATADLRLVVRSYDDVVAEATAAWEQRAGHQASGPLSDFRIVDHIRHRLTAYDQILALLRGRPGNSDAVAVLRRRVYGAIADAYPQLAYECRVQLAQRGLFPEAVPAAPLRLAS